MLVCGCVQVVNVPAELDQVWPVEDEADIKRDLNKTIWAATRAAFAAMVRTPPFKGLIIENHNTSKYCEWEFGT